MRYLLAVFFISANCLLAMDPTTSDNNEQNADSSPSPTVTIPVNTLTVLVRIYAEIAVFEQGTLADKRAKATELERKIRNVASSLRHSLERLQAEQRNITSLIAMLDAAADVIAPYSPKTKASDWDLVDSDEETDMETGN